MRTGSGCCDRHSEAAKPQRGAKEQPAGRRPGRGGWPSIPVSLVACSGEGTADNSPRVYGCNGAPKTLAVEPTSMIRPEYITATSLTSPPTTARSWLT